MSTATASEHLPIHDESHVRNAIARFNQTDFESKAAKERARKKILAAAERHDIEVDEDSNVREPSAERRRPSRDLEVVLVVGELVAVALGSAVLALDVPAMALVVATSAPATASGRRGPRPRGRAPIRFRRLSGAPPPSCDSPG